MNQQLLDNNYLIINNFISQEKAKYLNDWVINKKNKGELDQDPRVSEGLYAHVCLNGLPFIQLLCEKINEVSCLISDQVLPTYTYAILYKNNSSLIRHTDRHACEISLTLHLEGDEKWDLGIKKLNGDEVKIHLNVGDALLYLGCKAEHWREGLYQGKNYNQVMLHYVRSNGPNAWAFFDKKK